MKKPGFNTRAIHGDLSKPDAHQSIRYPLYASVAYSFDNAEEIEGAFTGARPAHVYSRSTNPTVEAFERKMISLEQGVGAVALSSGMAAITNTILCLLKSGENILASPYLFGNTYSLFKHTLPNYGIETRFVDFDDMDTVKQAVDSNTRVVFFETISNPQMVVPDIKQIAEFAKSNDLICIVDSTVTSPYLFKACEYNVDIVIHSTTKYISGGATSVGGIIIDMGKADWEKIPSLEKYKNLQPSPFLARLRKEVYRNTGSCLSPQAAYLQSLGLETLSLRISQSSANAMELARMLEKNSKVRQVHYPGLESSPVHELASSQYSGKFGGILSFELEDRKTCFAFQDALRLIQRATNLNDNFTLIIHPHSTIYADLSEKEKAEAGISEGLLRLSVGIEDVEDLIEDLEQALNSL